MSLIYVTDSELGSPPTAHPLNMDTDSDLGPPPTSHSMDIDTDSDLGPPPLSGPVQITSGVDASVPIDDVASDSSLQYPSKPQGKHVRIYLLLTSHVPLSLSLISDNDIQEDMEYEESLPSRPVTPIDEMSEIEANMGSQLIHISSNLRECRLSNVPVKKETT